MANTTYAYVRSFESSTPSSSTPLLPNTFLLIRIDGHKFHAFSSSHGFERPNDERASRLMDRAAAEVMKGWPDVVMGFGESDEYSFLVRRQSTMHNRRADKITSLIVSLFTSAYVFYWSEYFPTCTPSTSANPATIKIPTNSLPSDVIPHTTKPSSSSSSSTSGASPPSTESEKAGEKANRDSNRLRYPPSFDCRVVMYPSEKEVRDYFSWRQADTHINNLYNTTFWALVQQGEMSTREANEALEGTFSKDKHEILFSRFGIRYGNISARWRKGSILVRKSPAVRERSAKAAKELDVIGGRPASERNATGKEHTGATTESMADVISRATIEEVVDGSQEERSSNAIPQAMRPPRESRPAKQPKAYDGTYGEVVVLHEDVIGDEASFWKERPWLLA